MNKKIKKFIEKHYYIILLFLILSFAINFDYYVYSPGGLIDLTDRIVVDKSYKQKGSFNMTYVTSRNANLFNVILSFIIPSWDLESMDDMRVEDENAKEIEARDKIYLEESSSDALIAAFNEAHIPYTVKSIDLKVTYVYNAAKTNIKANDIIKSINGVKLNNFNDLVSEANKYKEGYKIVIQVLRNKKEVECYSKLIKLGKRVGIGVSIAEIKNITTNPSVEFVYKKNESGSSRGLMCALDIYNKITKYDLTKGRVISGTGTIREDGTVGAIGGVKYKIKGAEKKHADIFIVPKDNYEEAVKVKKQNHLKIKIIKADNLHNVIEKLK